eukprot:8976608-Pyramimonas_sp.AAC.1
MQNDILPPQSSGGFVRFQEGGYCCKFHFGRCGAIHAKAPWGQVWSVHQICSPRAARSAARSGSVAGALG